jgi:hypothetical protein
VVSHVRWGVGVVSCSVEEWVWFLILDGGVGVVSHVKWEWVGVVCHVRWREVSHVRWGSGCGVSCKLG